MKKSIGLMIAILFTTLGAESAFAVAKCRPFTLATGYEGCEVCISSSCVGTGWSTWNCNNHPNCTLKKNEMAEEELPQFDSKESGNYFGERNSVNMSGNGRQTSAKARLDACWNNGYSVTDSISNVTSCYTSCDNGTTNHACSGLTGADSCYSRCDTVYGNKDQE